MDRATSLKSSLMQRRCATGIRRDVFSGLAHIPLYRLIRIEQGHPASLEEMQRYTVALKMAEQALADIRDVFAVAVPA